METSFTTDPFFEYSRKGGDIAQDMAHFDQLCEAGQILGTEYDSQLTSFAERALAYLRDGLQKFPHDFTLEIEAETFARSLSGRRKIDFAMRFNELLYTSINDPVRPVDPITDKSRLQHAVDLTSVADRINDSNFYDRPNRVRELGDAIVGRVVLTMLSFNVDPRSLRIPVR